MVIDANDPDARTALRRQPFRRTPASKTLAGSARNPQRTIRFQLTVFGLGATFGTGTFFVLSEAAPEPGPAVILSFGIAGIAAGLYTWQGRGDLGRDLPAGRS